MAPFAKIVFGPGCPEALRMAVHHAERLAKVTAQAHEEQKTPKPKREPEPAAREAWLIGRAAEIEMYVLDVLLEWRAHKLTTVAAIVAIERYMDHVHQGMRAKVTGGERPSCCSLDDLVTREAPPIDEEYSGGFSDAARTLYR